MCFNCPSRLFFVFAFAVLISLKKKKLVKLLAELSLKRYWRGQRSQEVVEKGDYT